MHGYACFARWSLVLAGALILSACRLTDVPSRFGACPAPPREITATFSIVAADPETGVCGAAVASKYPAVGKVVPFVRAGVGAFCTQHWSNSPWGPRALD